MADLPSFRYHPNPVGTGVIVKRLTQCPVRQKHRDYTYEGPFYSTEEVEDICPWCIHDGSAAIRFKGEFQDSASAEEGPPPQALDELIHRTPGYCGWQQERWLAHCNDFCAFLGYVGWKEIEPIIGELQDDIESEGYAMEELKESLLRGGSHQGYLFRCLHCGRHRFVCDLD
ncbi:MAG: CbrC family protein [Phycisphaerae bacterium]|nr:CbrC family protein [Phycisphaerae bacterium]